MTYYLVVHRGPGQCVGWWFCREVQELGTLYSLSLLCLRYVTSALRCKSRRHVVCAQAKTWSIHNLHACHCARSCDTCMYCLFVGCLTSHQHASVSQGRICSDKFTCCHTEIEVADLSTSPSHSILTPGQPVPALAL